MSVREQFTTSPRYGLKNVGRVASKFLRPRTAQGDQVRVESLDEVSKRIAVAITRAIRTFDCEQSPRHLSAIRSMLESLPLTTSEFELARNRIKNSVRYADINEPGAAIYELRLLLRWLRNWK